MSNIQGYGFTFVLLMWVVALYFVLKFISLKVDEMYIKKQKPKGSGIKCPRSRRELKDFELFMGHCFGCESKSTCGKGIKNQKNESKRLPL